MTERAETAERAGERERGTEEKIERARERARDRRETAERAEERRRAAAAGRSGHEVARCEDPRENRGSFSQLTARRIG